MSIPACRGGFFLAGEHEGRKECTKNTENSYKSSLCSSCSLWDLCAPKTKPATPFYLLSAHELYKP
jgi:hypothetical protein